jgi:hypothetical protein
MKHHVVQVVATASAAIALAITAAATAATSTRGAAAVTLPPGNSVEQWDKIAEDTVVGSGAFQNEGLLYMAYVSTAMYDAAASIQGGYKPLEPPFRASKKASPDAAVASAAYRTLSNYFPAASATLDPLYAQALAAIPDGPAKLAGEKVGRVASDQVVRARNNDGRMGIAVTSTFPTLTAGPGVWRLTPSAYATPQTPWLGNVHPFILKSASQFLPGPPPSLSSQEWVDAFNEIKAYGGAGGTARTPDQTATALFWTANVIRQYNGAVRDLADARGLDVLRTARLTAMLNVVMEDAGISLMYAKYHYLFWRPVTAIDPSSVSNDGFGPTPGFNDGNAATAEQAGWRPLVATPNHPEYPSAHASVSSAAGEVFQQFLGTSQINIDIHGFDAAGTAGNLNAVRHFATTADLRTQVGNARIWAGLHYRFSVNAGNALGLSVASYDLAHAFQATS